MSSGNRLSTSPAIPRLITVVRHFQSSADQQDVHSGQLNTYLTVAGLRGAEQLGERLRGLAQRPFEIVSSTRMRCLQTAKALAAGRDIRIWPEPGLVERDFGALQGVHRSVHREVRQAEWVAWTKNGDVAPPGGETRDAMEVRVARALARIFSNRPGMDLVIVTHGGPPRVIEHQLQGVPWELLWEKDLPAGVVNAFQLEPEIEADFLERVHRGQILDSDMPASPQRAAIDEGIRPTVEL